MVAQCEKSPNACAVVEGEGRQRRGAREGKVGGGEGERKGGEGERKGGREEGREVDINILMS